MSMSKRGWCNGPHSRAVPKNGPRSIDRAQDRMGDVRDASRHSDAAHLPSLGETHNLHPKDAWISNRNGAAETVTPETAQHEIERLKSDNRDLARQLAAARRQLEEKIEGR